MSSRQKTTECSAKWTVVCSCISERPRLWRCCSRLVRGLIIKIKGSTSILAGEKNAIRAAVQLPPEDESDADKAHTDDQE